MNNWTSFVFLLVGCLPMTAIAQDLNMKWGLENTWSYRVTHRTLEQDGAYRPETNGGEYLTFEFIEGKPEVDKLRFKCFERHFELWDRYRTENDESNNTDGFSRADFMEYKSENDPACSLHAKRQAPVLYFDFAGKSGIEYILESIEISTLRFSEYRGGGFFERESWYDIELSHNEGLKTYEVNRRLVFTGHGRAELRLWSDNYYEQQGWIAPMGEYLIDIKFIFTSDGDSTDVSTGPFKIDV